MSNIYYELIEKGGKYGIKRYEKSSFKGVHNVMYLSFHSGRHVSYEGWTSWLDSAGVWHDSKEKVEERYHKRIEYNKRQIREKQEKNIWMQAKEEVLKRWP